MLHSHYETAFYKMKRISIHGNVVNTPFGCHTEHIRAGKRLTLKINLNRHCYVARLLQDSLSIQSMYIHSTAIDSGTSGNSDFTH